MTDTHNPSLGEVLEQFMTSGSQPDHEKLAGLTSAHPDYAEELTEFAAEWSLLNTAPLSQPDVVGKAELEMAASAMARLKAHLHQNKSCMESAPQDNPFGNITAPELKGLAVRLNLDTSLMAKIKNRLIQVETLPRTLIESLARELALTSSRLTSWLGAPPRLSGARFKAVDKPQTLKKETFQEAVARSHLSQTQKTLWQDQPRLKD